MNKKIIIVLGIIWGLVLCSGFAYYQLKSSSEKIHIINPIEKNSNLNEKQNFEKITIYTVTNNKLATHQENIPLSPKLRDKIKSIVEINLKNLQELKVLTNEKVEIDNIYIKGDTVFLDISNISELKTENRKNLLSIYSIVNSITELGNIRKVKILVNGREETGIFTNTYTRNTNI
ncbi:GerMN domain-containing protein [Fusobacterium sp.]|uniref:GerMN domain-containing protein n=1 Tax=Fusobacterium sp. TaxID=68766 RepID=UPI0025BF920F|nr:GerMN domain-containing protein [Fusobacterium sp.]